jgi:cytidine deaminase
VEAQRRQSKLWRTATIHKVRKSSKGERTYDLIWGDTKDKEKEITSDRVRKITTMGTMTHGSATTAPPPLPATGSSQSPFTVSELVTSNLLTSGNVTLNITTGEVLSDPYHAVAQTAVEDGHAAYNRQFAGLSAIGKTGMTYLEELIDGALRSAANATGSTRVGAALLTETGKMFAGCNVESAADRALSVPAERTCVLKAASEGETDFVGLVIAQDQSEHFPLPDGSARQFLSEYGDFPVFSVNADMQVKRFTTYELFPLAKESNKAGVRAARKRTKDDMIARENRDEAEAIKRDIRDWTNDDVSSAPQPGDRAPPQPVSQHPVRPITCATSPAAGGVRGVSPRRPEILPASAAPLSSCSLRSRASSPRFCPLLPQTRSCSSVPRGSGPRFCPLLPQTRSCSSVPRGSGPRFCPLLPQKSSRSNRSSAFFFSLASSVSLLLTLLPRSLRSPLARRFLNGSRLSST